MASEFTPSRQYRETPAEQARNDRADARLFSDVRSGQLQGAEERLAPYLAAMREHLDESSPSGSGPASWRLPPVGSFAPPKRSGSPSVDTSEQAVYGASPGYGPVVTAGQVEREFGTLEDQPGWMNAKQFVQAGVESGLPLEKSKFLLTPERREYMELFGRPVDLLGGLYRDRSTSGEGGNRDALRTSVQYWDKSDPRRTQRLHENELIKADPRLSRNDYWDPNYERFSGALNGFMQFAGDPSSSVAGYMKQAELAPNALRFSAISSDPIASSAAWHQAQDRFHLGDTPILDIEEVPGESPDAKAARFRSRLQEARSLLRDLAPPSPQYVANAAVGGRASPGAAFLLDTLISAADPSLVAGLTYGMARRLMDPSVAYRGLLSRLLRSFGGETKDQMLPEYLMSSGIHSLTGATPGRTHQEFWASGEGAEGRSPEAHDDAVRQMEFLHGTRPQSISDTRTYLTPVPKQYESIEGFNPFML